MSSSVKAFATDCAIASRKARYIRTDGQLRTSMTEIENLDTYGRPNDLDPDDPAPREPRGDPDEVTEEFRVWLFDAEESEVVPDVYVVDGRPEPLDFRMWVFVGHGTDARFVMRASHKYGPDEEVHGGREDCCEVLFAGQSLSGAHCPPAVERLVTDLTGAEVDTPRPDGHGGPVKY